MVLSGKWQAVFFFLVASWDDFLLGGLWFYPASFLSNLRLINSKFIWWIVKLSGESRVICQKTCILIKPGARSQLTSKNIYITATFASANKKSPKSDENLSNTALQVRWKSMAAEEVQAVFLYPSQEGTNTLIIHELFSVERMYFTERYEHKTRMDFRKGLLANFHKTYWWVNQLTH